MASPGRAVGAVFEGALPDLFDAELDGVRVLASPIGGALTDLSPDERALVASAVVRRQAEFATGRRLARRLLSDLGRPVDALLRDEDRVPRWPAGVVGSISHAIGMCVVAVAPTDRVAALGVDVEPDAPLEAALWSRIATPRELEALARWPESDRGVLAHALFSVKECVYKAAFPKRRERWGFQDVEVRLLPERGRFEAETPSARPGERERVAGRLLRRGGFLVAGVAHAR